MTPLAVTGQEVSLVVHIVAVVVGLGSTVVESITFPVALKLGPRHLPYVHQLHHAINLWLATPGLVIILGTGIYQASDAGYDFGALWISASMGIVLVLAALVTGYLIPEDRRLKAMVERELAAAASDEPTLSDEYRRRARNTGAAGGVAGVLVIAAIYLMVTKPGL